MAKNFYGVRRGRKRGVFDNWPRAQEQVALYRGAEYRGFDTRAEALAYVGGYADEHPYVEIHDGGNVTVAALTDDLRAALSAAGVTLPAL